MKLNILEELIKLYGVNVTRLVWDTNCSKELVDMFNKPVIANIIYIPLILDKGEDIKIEYCPHPDEDTENVYNIIELNFYVSEITTTNGNITFALKKK